MNKIEDLRSRTGSKTFICYSEFHASREAIIIYIVSVKVVYQWTPKPPRYAMFPRKSVDRRK